MESLNYSIRNFTKGDEAILASLFNQTMKEISPDIISLKPEDFKQIYKNNPLFKPEHIKFLLTPSDEIIGYGECRDYGSTKYLDYPLILGDYRSPEFDNLLFGATYQYLITTYPNSTIATHSYLDKYEQVHAFFQEQKIIKIKRIQEAVQFLIPVEDLNFHIDKYKIKAFTEKDIETLVEFRYSEGDIDGNAVTDEILLKGFQSGKYSPENSFLIYYDDKLVAWISTTIYTPINEAYARRDLKISIGVINAFVTNYDHNDRLGLEKAALRASYEYLSKKGIPEYRVWVVKSSQYYDLCQKLGLSPSGEVERGYFFE
jgi:hypothetical protein